MANDLYLCCNNSKDLLGLDLWGYKCHGRFRLRVEDCKKGRIKLRPKSAIPNSLCFLFLVSLNELTTQSLKFYSDVLNLLQ